MAKNALIRYGSSISWLATRSRPIRIGIARVEDHVSRFVAVHQLAQALQTKMHDIGLERHEMSGDSVKGIVKVVSGQKIASFGGLQVFVRLV